MKFPVNTFSFNIQNQSNDSVDIFIDGDIVDAGTQEIYKMFYGDETSVSFKSFRNEISKVDVRTYNIIINSPGGHVGDALAMHDYISELQRKGKIVNTKGIGLVASSATLLLLAGNEPEMAENAFFMMHTVSGGVYGNLKEVQNYAESMRKYNDKIKEIYANKSKMRKEEVTKYMEAETYFTAQEAKDKGLISKISGEVKVSNILDPNKYPQINKVFLNRYNNTVNKTNMKKFFTDLASAVKSKFSAVKPAVESAEPAVNQQKLIENFSEALSGSFESQAEAFENAVNLAVQNAVNSVKTELEAKITALESEIAGMKGKPTNQQVNKAEKVIGSFS